MVKQIIFIIVKFTFLILPFICMSILVRCFPMFFMDEQYAAFKYNKEYTEGHEKYCRILIMGDSLAKISWIPDELSDDTFNFALLGNSPVENYYYLYEYLQNNEAPKYIFYTQATDRFLYSGGNFWKRNLYFHRINADEILDIYKTEKESGGGYIFEEKSLFDAALYLNYSPSCYSAAFINGLMSNRYKKNMDEYNYVVKYRGRTEPGKGKGYNGVHSIVNYTSFDYNSIPDLYVRKMLELCREKSIKMIYQAPPLNRATYKKLNENFLREYNKYMQKLQDDYPEALINGQFYYYDNIYFNDDWLHLNENGAIKFSREMKQKYNYIFDPQEAGA